MAAGSGAARWTRFINKKNSEGCDCRTTAKDVRCWSKKNRSRTAGTLGEDSSSEEVNREYGEKQRLTQTSDSLDFEISARGTSCDYFKMLRFFVPS